MPWLPAAVSLTQPRPNAPRHNPAKLVEVDTILAKYRGREDKLFAALRKRYNLPAE